MLTRHWRDYEKYMKKIILILTIGLIFISCQKKQVPVEQEQVTPLNMVYIEGGSFMMGYTDYENVNGIIQLCSVPRKVTLDDFKMSTTEITQSQYKQLMGERDDYDFYSPDYPVELITWYEAVEFCNRLSEKDGFEKCYSYDGEDVSCNFSADGYRLPTEAEWYYAAIGGKYDEGFSFSGSNNSREVDAEMVKHDLSPVATKKCNQLGLYDMTGNVYEWCWDWFDINEFLYDTPLTNPKGPENKDHKITNKVIKGGDTMNLDNIKYRAYSDAKTGMHNVKDETYVHLGFRVCQSVVKESIK